MISVKHYPIEWYVEQLKKNEYFSLAGFGDGEFLCVQGKKGGNSHGCAYSPELREDLKAAMGDNHADFYKGMQRILPKQFREIRPLLTGNWVDREILGDALARGALKPFFDAIWENYNVIIVSSKEKKSFPRPKDLFIETPRTNTHAEKEAIVKKILNTQIYGPKVFLYACGMAAAAIIHEVHGRVGHSFHLDIGHILDPFCDENLGISRDYLQDIPRSLLDQNI